jgi:hypothetical protein
MNTKKATKKKRASAPARGRPQMPPGYISAKSDRGLVPWSGVLELLEGAPGYWLATTDPDGRPHLVQQWGAWVDDRWYFEGSPETRWARNLARDPRAVMSVERGSEVAIVYGEVTLGAAPEADARERIAKAYNAKYLRTYQYRQTAEQIAAQGMHALTPSKVLSWDVKRFGQSPTRFRFAARAGSAG